MNKKNRSLTLLLTLDAIIFLLCIVGIYHVSQKATLPLTVEHNKDGLHITDLLTENSNIHKNDLITKVLHYPIENIEEVECILDGINVNEKVSLTLQRGDKVYKVEVRATSFYSFQYLLIASLVSIAFFIIGIFVLIKRPGLRSAKLLHAGSISTGIILATTWGNYNIEPLGIGYLIRVIFSAAYSFGPMFFIDFTLSLRKRKRKSYKFLRPLLYSISFILFLLQSYSFIQFINNDTIASIHLYLKVFSIFRVYLITYLIIGLLIIFYTYRTTIEEYEKKRLRWILFGFSIGLIGLIVLWIIPYLFMSTGLVYEEVLLLMVLTIPITFAISIVRYNWLDIDLIIERSIVYSLVIIILLLTYASLLVFITEILNIDNNKIPTIITVLLIVFFFQPINLKLQSFVNKKFFRIQYNFRKVLTSFIGDIKHDFDIESIANKMVDKIDQIIPIESIGFFIVKYPENELNMLTSRNCNATIKNNIQLTELKVLKETNKPLAKKKSVEPGAAIIIVDEDIISFCDFKLAIPMKSKSNLLIGLMVLGERKSKTRFTIEDIDILSTIASRAANTIERINLQEELIKEHLETERLEELNELKSLFVSTVSHDLKTPLTSIKLFSEMLQNKNDIPDNKRKEYLQIIEGESDRLTRLINNVLDFAKIEKGIKEYKYEELSVNSIVNEVLVMMEYQFRIKNFELHKSMTDEEKIIVGDKDAIAEALINLLSNAIKYSDEERVISVSTIINDEYYSISVEDHGIGIKESELADIIIPYFRSDDQLIKSVSGAGLGLAIVKHIMNAHHGKIDISSTWKKGSTITLSFPIGEKNEKNINN